MFNKKGAMFGLDARIALAIFGALSVISGAALYSAIQQSRIVSLVTQMDEMGKAYFAYYLDTGVELDYADTSGNMWDINPKGLVVKPTGVNNWKGPYIPYEVHSNDLTLVMPGYDFIFFMRATDDAWNGSTSGLATSTCDLVANANKACYVWVAIRKSNEMEAMAKAVDLYIDGSETLDTGKVRVIDNDYVAMQVGISQINN